MSTHKVGIMTNQPPFIVKGMAYENVHDAMAAMYNPPDWDRFRGNNHEYLDAPQMKYGGGISFTGHIGKPLSVSLWDDLIYRLQVRSMRIYGPDSCQWCDAPRCIAYIYLDKNDNVRDIYYVP